MNGFTQSSYPAHVWGSPIRITKLLIYDYLYLVAKL